MDYMHQNPFTYGSQHQQQFFYPQVQYPAYVAHAQPAVDEYYLPYNRAAEYTDFMDPNMIHDDVGESQEVSTRPRLTKAQAEVLESHFQANHKPSSQVKRELALQTGLNLNRVGNWFQNRRAKAKQQKRQEEYEAQNAPSKDESRDPDDDDEGEESLDTTSTQASRSEAVSPTESLVSSTTAPSTTATADSNLNLDLGPTSHAPPLPVQGIDNSKSKEASWNSLQRALGQAKAAQAQQLHQVHATMPPPEVPMQTTASKLPTRLNEPQHAVPVSYAPAWQSQHANAMHYASPITLQDNSFDFGFGDDIVEPIPLQGTTMDNAADYLPDSFEVTPEALQGPLVTPKGFPQQHHDPMIALPSPGFALPSYPGSRRPSATEDLSHHFGTVALAGTPPSYVAERYDAEHVPHPQGSPLDIAARRKRPRPAALTFASLRSRSHGAMTSLSPTIRQGMMSPQGAHSVRHVKSAGQSLHSRFAGVRKVSSAQRSPMCASTFAEAEAFNQLMAQQAIATTPLTELPEPVLSPEHVSNAPQVVEAEKNPYFVPNMDVPNQYSMQAPQNLSIATASPPVTPMVANFMTRAPSQASLMPPASAPAQYATFQDYTPPYSAGPLTNGSWSDAPVTSPDIPSFPVTYMPSLGYPQHYDGGNGQFQHFVLRSDNKSEVDLDALLDQKKTEFYIQEFPNQKEEHASVAQQLAQQKPKNYVFANTAPQDYNGA